MHVATTAFRRGGLAFPCAPLTRDDPYRKETCGQPEPPVVLVRRASVLGSDISANCSVLGAQCSVWWFCVRFGWLPMLGGSSTVVSFMTCSARLLGATPRHLVT